MKQFFHKIQLRKPRPLSHLWTVSTMAGISRPRLERKMAPQRLMNSSKSGKAAASATVKKIIIISEESKGIGNILVSNKIYIYIFVYTYTFQVIVTGFIVHKITKIKHLLPLTWITKKKLIRVIPK